MAERVLIIRSSLSLTAKSVVLPALTKTQSYLVPNQSSEVLEVQRVKQFFSSWIVGDEIISDGGLFLGTPVDPLIILLPILERSRKRVRRHGIQAIECHVMFVQRPYHHVTWHGMTD